MTPESRTGDTGELHRGLSEGHTGARARARGTERYREVQRRTERARAGKVKGKE